MFSYDTLHCNIIVFFYMILRLFINTLYFLCVSIKPCHSHSHIAQSKILILFIWINILYKIALNSLTLKLLCQLECDKVGHFLVTVQKLFKPIFRSHLILKHFSLNHFILRLKVFVKIVFEVGNFCICSNF